MSVTDLSADAARPDSVATGVLVAPYHLPDQAEDDPVTERFVSVVEPGTERLVAVIELVSPSNERGDGIPQFRAERELLLEAGAPDALIGHSRRI